MAVSKKVKQMMEQSSWVRKMFETGAELKATHGAENVFDFSLGNPNVPPPVGFQQTLEEEVAEELPGKHGYMPNAGYPSVREAVAGYVSEDQQVGLGPESVIMTAGAGGALNVALKTIVNPGDTVLVMTPFFPEYRFYADNHGATVKQIPARDDFDLDLDAIARAIDTSTCAVLINSPNNPAGTVYPQESIEALGDLLERKSRELGRTIYLISDEPYRKIVFDGLEVPSVLAAYKNSFAAASYSKELSVPGERIGWLIINPQAEDFQNLVDGAILSNRILGFVNAPALMQRVIARLQGSHVDVELYRRKRDMLCSGLEEIGYRFQKPQGTFYLFPQAPGGDDLEAVRVLQDELVLTVPGKGFGCPGYFRISFCVEDRVIEKAMPGFERAFEKLS
jgi:aspartate aminotransferase